MFCFVYIILLCNILLFRIGFGLKQDEVTDTICDCSCDVQIDIVKHFLKDLEDIRKCTDKMSNIEAQLLRNRASKPSSCMEAAANSLESGIYKIQIKNVNVTDVEVFCEEGVDLGGWLVIQRRQSGSVDFKRDWHDYKDGFGTLTGNYWIGMEKLHALTNNCEQELYIQMKRRNGQEYYAKYSKFLIGNEVEIYALKKLGDYSGNAGDSLRKHLGMKFSTYDRDNDGASRNCALIFEGGWWFDDCYRSHLNGVYGDDNAGVNWRSIEEDESLSFAQMLIRPNHNCLRRSMLRN
ncbi:fibrinogen C domain-containing protein 1 [Zeugodacus cucurbitae]|nr:fibrinogen C domain-containing protein 1 [Zeugodacus cucurbitae]